MRGGEGWGRGGGRGRGGHGGDGTGGGKEGRGGEGREGGKRRERCAPQKENPAYATAIPKIVIYKIMKFLIKLCKNISRFIENSILFLTISIRYIDIDVDISI
jgi:hypothetical protein